jgi:hypothetical protein
MADKTTVREVIETLCKKTDWDAEFLIDGEGGDVEVVEARIGSKNTVNIKICEEKKQITYNKKVVHLIRKKNPEFTACGKTIKTGKTIADADGKNKIISLRAVNKRHSVTCLTCQNSNLFRFWDNISKIK